MTGGTPLASALCGEDERARVLSAYGADGLVDDPDLTAITAFAARLCGTPIALVSLVEAERQRFLARNGIDALETPRSTSFCAHAMLDRAVMVVPDARVDPRFSGFELVTGAIPAPSCSTTISPRSTSSRRGLASGPDLTDCSSSDRCAALPA
ncbi:hypothetical protein J4558_21340 [Leptolyngbya sp. 15MV]|nr:hypothetical protein J4558_21340 [Leptolyngbya sp. 15MV]